MKVQEAVCVVADALDIYRPYALRQDGEGRLGWALWVPKTGHIFVRAGDVVDAMLEGVTVLETTSDDQDYEGLVHAARSWLAEMKERLK